MNIDDIFTKYNKSLEPSPGQEERVKEKVFSRLNGKRKFNLLSLTQMKFLLNKKLLIGGSLALLLVIFVGTPLLFAGGNGYGSNFASQLITKTNNGVSLNEDSYDDGEVGVSKDIVNTPSYNASEDNDTKEEDRAKLKTGSISLIVGNVQDAANEINTLIVDMDGFIQSSKITKSDKNSRKWGTIVFKVPVSKFDRVVLELKSMAIEVEYENIEIYDWQNEVTSYTKSLDEINAKIADLEKKLAAETDTYKKSDLEYQISTLKSQKKSIEDSLNEVSNKTLFSTLTVNLKEKTADVEEATSFERAVDKAKEILKFWENVIYWMIPASVICIPPVLILLAVYIVIRVYRRSKIQKS